MNCAAALDLMLEADLADLESPSDSELGRHLGECASCRAAAQRILLAERTLREQLATASPLGTADAALRAALARSARRGRLIRLGVPLAAAAGLLVFLVGRERSLQLGQPLAVAPPLPPPMLRVTAPPGRNVAVLRTDNPDVVVFWFF
jgi:hypothetical protein